VRAFDAGLKIPKEIAIVGCGNFHYSSKLRVPLSSVDQHAGLMGERTSRMITTLLEKTPANRPRSVVLEPLLVARDSSLRR
jgi:LacI family transcriptional regulator